MDNKMNRIKIRRMIELFKIKFYETGKVKYKDLYNKVKKIRIT
jgi:hypothetical protein